MNQFFFGSAASPLYGVHHEPTSTARRQAAVLVCYPIGREYMRCHRALVRFCDRLSASGYHVLRFDYFGTGDSAGDNGDGNVDQWVANTRMAAQELRDIAGTERISILGVRLGAAIATLAAAMEKEVDTLLLWDPVVDGNSYLDQLLEMHSAFVTDLDRFPRGRDSGPDLSGDELVGMTCPPTMRQSIQGIDMTRIGPVDANMVYIIGTTEHSGFADMQRHLEHDNVKSEYILVDENPSWYALSELGVVMMPHKVLHKMAQILDAN